MCFVSSHYITNEQPSGGREERQQGGQKKTDEEKECVWMRGAEWEEWGGEWRREMETSLGTFSSSPLHPPFPHTSESNWTKTVI